MSHQLRTDTARLDRAITECRSAGYLVAALMAGMSSTLPDELRALRTSGHDINMICAPVFDHHSRQAMVLSLQIGRSLTASEIDRCASSLVAGAAALTAQLGGCEPEFG